MRIGTVHGFGCRPNLGIPKVKASWELAMQDIVSWIKETL
jgi:carboxymethylenebutenolidase